MELMKRIIGFAAAVALMLGMTAGIANAQSTDGGSGSVTLSCGEPMSVSINDFTFAPIDLYVSNDTATAEDAVQITVDMGCYWGPWQVSASATPFTSGTTLQTFSASHMSFVDADVAIYSLEPIDFLGILEPTASNANFGTSGNTVLETAENFFLWWQLPDSPAPFVTTATYTGTLTDLPFIFATLIGNSHTFTSTITVTLAAI